MSSKWTPDNEGKSDAGVNSPTSEEKDGSGGGRRSRRPRPGRGSTSAASAASEEASKGEAEKPDIKTRTGGWGLHGATADSQRKSVVQMGTMEALDQKGTGRAAARRNHFDNEETEILLIPDLEGDGEDDIVSKVAAAPKNTTRRVPSLRELDEDLKSSLPSAADGLDMSLLTKTLVPREMLEEADIPWDFDSLLQSITQDLNAEKLLTFESGAEAAEGTDLGNPRGGTLQESSTSRLQGGGRSNRAMVA